jgi:hypothetical protein
MEGETASEAKNGSPGGLLKKWQRNQIFKEIVAAGLNPREFALNDANDKVEIKHKGSESRFIVSRESTYYIGKYVVGDGWAWPYGPTGWEALMRRVVGWLEEVKHDLETPDLWASLQHEGRLLEAGSNEVTENTPFTPEEQKEIARGLGELAEYIRNTHSLSGVQMHALNEKLDYLVDASGRLGRKD